MIKFFRKIRQRLISQKKFNTYFYYGIGEIFLVVIGILIALQLNNLNENKKLRSEEKKTLLALHYEISNNLLTLNRSIREKKDIINANNEILKYSSPYGEWESNYSLDSLMYHITVSGWIYLPDNGVFNEIINAGKLSIIEDEKIKHEISSLTYLISIVLEEDRLYRDDLHQYFLPYISKIYTLRNPTKYRQLHEFSTSSLGNTKFRYQEIDLIRDKEFENILSIQAIWIKFSIDMCENLRLKYFNIQKLIKEKYPNVNFSELSENIERGFWG